MNKKSQEMNGVTVLILVLISAFVLFLIVDNLILTGKNVSNKELCKLSIAASSKSKFITGSPMFNLNCEPSILEIRKRDVLEGREISENKIYSKISAEMYDCWDMVGSGKLDPFSQWVDVPNYCLMCTRITFDESIHRERVVGKIKLNSPWQWMAKNNIPGQEINLFTAITGTQPNKDILDKIAEAEQNEYIDTSKEYVVIWRGDKNGILFLERFSMFFGIIPFGFGIKHCITDSCHIGIINSLHFVPVEKLSETYKNPDTGKTQKFCTILLN